MRAAPKGAARICHLEGVWTFLNIPHFSISARCRYKIKAVAYCFEGGRTSFKIILLQKKGWPKATPSSFVDVFTPPASLYAVVLGASEERRYS